MSDHGYETDKFVLYLDARVTMGMRVFLFRSVDNYGYQKVCFVFGSVDG